MAKKQKKSNGLKFVLLLVLIVSAFSVFSASKASASGNVYGWTWSENIGWISFNKDTCPIDNNSTGGGGSFDYGVNIDASGNLSGYAWSENIGWIKFDPVGPYPAAPDYSAKATMSGSYPVTGWARACSVFDDLNTCSGTLNSNRGGWDGWINLYNISIDIDVNPAQFHNWAWGSDDTSGEAVIGWGTFNCFEGGATNENICPTTNYKVVTTFSFDRPPQIESMGRTSNYCTAPGAGTVSFSWTYIGENPESRFQFQIDDSASFDSLEINRDYTGLSNPSGTINSQAIIASINPTTGEQLAFNTTYYWRVKVYDNQSADSGWINGSSFTTASHAYPSPSFTIAPASPLVNTVVSFTDQSICYDANNNSQSCSTTGNSTYTWTFGDGNINNVKGDTSHAYTLPKTSPGYPAVLQICDDVGCCSAAKNINVRSPSGVPGWKEVSPF